LSRDPIGERGGINCYNFCGNDGRNYFDALGLVWKIDRHNRARATVTPETGDTVSSLAQMIGLDDKDYRDWLKAVGPSRMPASVTAPITECSQFTIPNTVYLEFGQQFKLLDPAGPIPIWRRYLYRLGAEAVGAGYNVVITDPSSPDEARRHLQSSDIYFFAYAGHGGGEGENPDKSVGLLVFSGGEGSTSLDGARFTKYGIRGIEAYACSSASQHPGDARLGYLYSPWEKNVSTRGQFVGIWGEVNGWQPWSHEVLTPGTNNRGRGK